VPSQAAPSTSIDSAAASSSLAAAAEFGVLEASLVRAPSLNVLPAASNSHAFQPPGPNVETWHQAVSCPPATEHVQLLLQFAAEAAADDDDHQHAHIVPCGTTTALPLPPLPRACSSSSSPSPLSCILRLDAHLLSPDGRRIDASDHVRFHAHYPQGEQSMAGEEVGTGTGSSEVRSAAVRWQEGT
jgi:hypothetical protein